jgi:(p)ppGpp synthase/HD superfamily hydrolase
MSFSLIDKAIQIAAEAHATQKQKNGQPYILHPLRVMARVQTEDEQIVAILHDVLEDTPWTAEQLKQRGFPPHILHALDCVTKRQGEHYEDFVTRSASDPIALCVKLADLEDNMDVRRLPEVTPNDQERLNKYLAAYRRLSAILHNSPPSDPGNQPDATSSSANSNSPSSSSAPGSTSP